LILKALFFFNLSGWRSLAIMADVATPSGAAMFDGGAQDKKEKKVIEKPEKPDEETYKAALKKAEKEHAASMEKFVSAISTAFISCGGGHFRVGASREAACRDKY
jgi:hypothetical protein